MRLNDDLVSRYRLTLAGTGTLRGHTCWKIDFEPKSGKLPMKKRIDGALNKSTGQFWISQEDYGLVRLEFAMREPYKYWGGFLATINDTDATLEFERVATDLWVPQSFDLGFDIKVLMMASIRRRLVRRVVRLSASPDRCRDSMTGRAVTGSPGTGGFTSVSTECQVVRTSV